MLFVALGAQTWAAPGPFKVTTHCELAGISHQIELLRGSPIADSLLYKLRYDANTFLLFKDSESSRGSDVEWRCVKSPQGTGVFVISGEFTANFLQGAAFYFNPQTRHMERVDFAERNRPRWVLTTEQGARVIFENTGNETARRYLVYGKDDFYQEVDELPEIPKNSHHALIELDGARP